MPTSNSFNYVETLNSWVTDSLSALGFLGTNESPSAVDMARAKRYCNRIVKSTQVKNSSSPGVQMWQRQIGYLFLSTTTGTYSLSAGNPLWANNFNQTTSGGNNPANAVSLNLANAAGAVQNTKIYLILDDGSTQTVTATANAVGNTVAIQPGLAFSMNSTSDIAYVLTDTSAQPPQLIDGVVLRNSTGNDLTIDQLTLDQYISLPGKNQPGFAGDPQAIYFEPHLIGTSTDKFSYVKTDVSAASDPSKYLVIYYVREVQDLINESDIIDCPQEMYEYLIWRLAKALAPTYNMVWDRTMEENYQMAMRLAMNSQYRRNSSKFKRRNSRGTFNSPPHR